MTEQPFISIEHLTHIYNADSAFERAALTDINVTINRGEFIGLIGHTGSGKSTLIQHLNVLLRPSAGRILIDGEDINADKRRLKQIRQKVGLVFQYPEHQLFEETVYKDVAFGPKNMGLPQQEIDSRVKEALALVGLSSDAYEKSPFELSGGQKRRAAIAGVLAMRPDILILDEPTAGLDPGGRETILRQIKGLHTTLHNTIILVSHSMEDVAKLADRIFVMAQGRLALTGTPSEIFAEPSRLEAIGLDVPPLSALISQLNQKGLGLSKHIFTVEAAADAIYQAAGERGLINL